MVHEFLTDTASLVAEHGEHGLQWLWHIGLNFSLAPNLPGLRTESPVRAGLNHWTIRQVDDQLLIVLVVEDARKDNLKVSPVFSYIF